MNKQRNRWLITAHELRDALNTADDRTSVFDCTVMMHPEASGYRVESVRSTVTAKRIPGAYFLDLRDGLHDASNDQGFAYANDEQLQQTLRLAGISQDTHVVLYSRSHPMWATRVWWQLYAAGLNNVSILDGGFQSWREIGGETASGELATPSQGNVTIRTDPKRWADIAEMARTMQSSDAVSLCALPSASYAGTSDEHYGRPGHIPGSLNVPFEEMLQGHTFKEPDGLRSQFEARGLRKERRIICYCGGGIAATVDAFALTLLGYNDVAVYDGSMHEWSRDLSRPVATAEAP